MLESIGPFLNLLPLRFRLKELQSFQDALQEARSKTYAALSNSQVPFEILLNEFDTARSAAHNGSTQALESSILVGFPSPNELIYIVDDKMRLVPIGVPGEIVVGGVGIAIGYLCNEESTKRHSMPNIFAPIEYIRNGWTTMHCTGDKGRWNHDRSMAVRVDSSKICK